MKTFLVLFCTPAHHPLDGARQSPAGGKCKSASVRAQTALNFFPPSLECRIITRLVSESLGRNINYEGFLYILRPPVCFVRNHRRRLIAVAVFDSTENVPENSSSLAFTHIGRRGLDWVYRRHAEFRGFMVLDDVCSCDRRWLHGRRLLQVGVIPLASLFAASASPLFATIRRSIA
jgi:hypothetical protein